MVSDLSPELYKKILSFVTRETRTRKQLSLKTDIARDLGVDGDDAKEFICKFKNEFKVEMSNFIFDAYFGPEGFELTRFVRQIFLPRKNEIPLTIDILLHAAKEHRWPHVDAQG